MPLLCGDPHQPFWVPSSWYEYALHGPEEECRGRRPSGHSRACGGAATARIAWAITNNMASTRDLYPRGGEAGRSVDAIARATRGGSFDEGSESSGYMARRIATVTIRSTVRGPVVNALVPPRDRGRRSAAVAALGRHGAYGRHARQHRGVAREGLGSGFRDACAIGRWRSSISSMPTRTEHRLPDGGPDSDPRADHVRASAMRQCAADQWQGYIPFDEMPRSYDPPRGYVASANQRIVSPDYGRMPIYGAYSQGHRGVRLDQALAAAEAGSWRANIRLAERCEELPGRAARACFVQSAEGQYGSGRAVACRYAERAGMPIMIWRAPAPDAF